MRITISIHVLLAVFGVFVTRSAMCARPSDVSDPEVADVGRWLMTYYQKPDPANVARRISQLSKTGLLAKEGSEKLTGAFFARVFAANSDWVNEWCRAIDALPPQEQMRLWRAMHWAQTDTTTRVLAVRASRNDEVAHFCREIVATPVPNFRSIEKPDPDDLDASWASFFASGEPAYVENVIRCALQPFEPAEKGKLKANDLAPYAAKWSVKSLSEQDPRIREIVQLFRDSKATVAQRAILDELLTNVPATQQSK
jgi:hypothetical protein